MWLSTSDDRGTKRAINLNHVVDATPMENDRTRVFIGYGSAGRVHDINVPYDEFVRLVVERGTDGQKVTANG